MILDNDEAEDNDFIDEEEFGCTGVLLSSREIRPVERLGPQ